MPASQSLQIHVFGLTAHANGETAIYALAVVALAFVICLSLRRR